MTRSRVSDTRTNWPRLEAKADPIWTIRPSRPTEPPEPMQIADASAFTTVTGGRMRPPFSATATMTSGTPWPRASRAKRCTSGPYSSPPMTGTTSTNHGPSHGKVELDALPNWPNCSWPVASHVKPKIIQRNPTAPKPAPPPTTRAMTTNPRRDCRTHAVAAETNARGNAAGAAGIIAAVAGVAAGVAGTAASGVPLSHWLFLRPADG